MLEVNYDHSKEEFHEALGLTEEELNSVATKANSLSKPVVERNGTSTEIIQAYSTEMSKEELAILLFTVQNQHAQLKGHLMNMVGNI